MSVKVPFPFPSRPPSWHPGHMRSTLQSLSRLLSPPSSSSKSLPVDVVLEVRDARLPLTSVNPAFEKLVREKGKARLVVYNKRDLADRRLETPLRKAFAKHGQEIGFTDVKDDLSVRKLIHRLIAHGLPSAHRRHPPRSPSASSPSSDSDSASKDSSFSRRRPRRPIQKASNSNGGIGILVVGMPNVGKSSLLNALRRVGIHKGKTASVAPEPGHTRSLSSHVRIFRPSSLSKGMDVFISDTPGVMVPFLGEGEEGAERGLKLGLTAGLKESLYDHDDLANYLVHRLFLRVYQSPPPSGTPNPDDLEPSSSFTSSDLLASLKLPLDTPLPPYPFPTASLSDTSSASPTAPLEPLPTPYLLPLLAHRFQYLEKGGTPDLDRTKRALIQRFREGAFGGWTLDDLENVDTSPHLPVDADDADLLTQHRAPTTASSTSAEDSPTSELDKKVETAVTAFLASPEGKGELVSKTATKALEKADRLKAAAARRSR